MNRMRLAEEWNKISEAIMTGQPARARRCMRAVFYEGAMSMFKILICNWDSVGCKR
jgi:DNA-binding FadR family transcriptional regulator